MFHGRTIVQPRHHISTRTHLRRPRRASAICDQSYNQISVSYVFSIKIHLRDLTLIVISRPGYHTVLVQGPARTKRSSLARKYSKGGDSCVYSRKLSGAPSYVGRHCAPEQACSIWSSCLVLGLDRSVLVQAKRATIDCKGGGGGAKSLTW